MPKCTQCDRPALFELQGHFLCVEHWSMIQDRLAEQQRQSAAMLNYFSAYGDAVVGMPGLSPRLEIPQAQPQVFHHGDMNTYNNINVDRSTVGSINTGSVNSIDVTLGQLGQGGASEMAAPIKEFTEALLQEGGCPGRC